MLLRATKKNGVKELVGFGREECCHSREFLEGLIAMPAFLKRPEGVLHEHTRVSKAKTMAGLNWCIWRASEQAGDGASGGTGSKRQNALQILLILLHQGLSGRNLASPVISHVNLFTNCVCVASK